ncbi:response regulator, partial [Candidatus Saccharibacteria bacterium]|nr:response regulator [Candidatus Saccharibacteria bacterium]
MAKVLLVEDDTNLREIFEMRLQADGYETLTADNGEQALAIAMKDKPELIIADVMMPHLSGFEMLETLRAAPGMAQTKVIMMTALGQAEDQARGEKLGVIKYLVKSQVTLEDFARVVREVLPPGDQAPKQTKQESESNMQDDNNQT